MNNTEVIDRAFGESQRQCMWQITPAEMPKDMVPMALELWRTDDGLRIVQMYIDGERGGNWWSRVGSYTVFAHVLEAPPEPDEAPPELAGLLKL